MAYRKVHVSDVPKRPRKTASKFEKTEEWKMMKADLGSGLKRNEAVMVSMTEADKKRLGIRNRRTIVRFLQKYLDGHKMPYKLRSFQRDGADFFIVENRS